jgi:acyl-CoA reductase-like NAD-dependent aldehyde dehydrogenase
MVPCQLELGGKDPLYVCDDVKDVNAVAVATADGHFIIMVKVVAQ